MLLASLVSALLAAFFALMPWHPQVTAWSQFIDRLVGIPVQFGIFTGVVYWVARQFFGGTGRYAEVAYTFALFFVPLSLISTLVGWIPVVGWLLSLLISLAQIYFAYIAVQSSMNIREGAQPLLTLVVAAILTSALNWAVFGQWWLN